MKNNTLSACLVAVIILSPGTAVSQQASYLPTRAVRSGEFAIKSIDEQTLPETAKAHLRRRASAVAARQPLLVSDHDIPDFEAAATDHRLKGKDITGTSLRLQTSFAFANLNSTQLKNQPALGALSHGVKKGETWTGMSRMFPHPGLRYVVLEETDLRAAGGGVVFTKELVNENVNGAPATMVSKQSSPGKAVTTLTWYSDGVLYYLAAPGANVHVQAELMDIARRIHK